MDEPPESPADVTRLVDENGLVKLFANRVRARILVTLFYASEPLSVARIAESAGITQSATHEAVEALEPFEILVTDETADGTRTVALDDDELVAAVETVAELSTDRFHGE